jgi:hypothetical protein
MSLIFNGPWISSGILTGDGLICTGSGIIHSITFSCDDAAPTAGTINVNDGLTAGAGTELFSWTLTTAVFNPVTIFLDIPFSTGLFADFTTTADVNVIVTYLESSGGANVL